MPVKWPKAMIFVVVIIALVAALILLLIFWRPSNKESQIIKVGILYSLTGVLAGTEKPIVDTALLAIDEINEKGGILGKKIVPVIVDGKSDWPTFAREAERLIKEEQVEVIFGSVTSAARKTLQPVVEKYDILLFYPVQYEGLESSPNIIYLGSTANQQAFPAVTWSLQNLGKSFFLVGSDYIYQRAANALMTDLIHAHSAKVVGEEYVSLTKVNDIDVDRIIKKIKQTKPEIIINTISGSENARFFKALRKAGISSEKIPTISLCVTETELDAWDIDSMSGDYAAQNYFQSLQTVANKTFVEKFKRKFGAERVISSSMQNGYASLYFWKNAVEKAQTFETHAVRENLRGAAFGAPEGVININKDNLHTWMPVLIGKIFPNRQFGIVFNSVSTIEPLIYPPFRTKEYWDNLLKHWYAKWDNKWSRE